MTPDFPNNPREELEARLTALLLGELPADEAAALRQTIERDPELAKLYARLEHTIELVRETAASPAETAADQPAPLKLAEQRREKLLAHFKTIAPKEFAKPRREVSWMVPMAAAAAFVILTGFLAFINQESFSSISRLGFSLSETLSEKSKSENEQAAPSPIVSQDAASWSAAINADKPKGAVTTTTDQLNGRQAAEAALERVKSETLTLSLASHEPAKKPANEQIPMRYAKAVDISDGLNKLDGVKKNAHSSSLVDNSRDLQTTRSAPANPAPRPTLSPIALPSGGEVAAAADVDKVNGTRTPWFVSANTRGFYDDFEGLKPDLNGVAAPVVAGKPAASAADGSLNWGGVSPAPLSAKNEAPVGERFYRARLGHEPAAGSAGQPLALAANGDSKGANNTTATFGLVPLEIKLPQPAFKGTPKDMPRGVSPAPEVAGTSDFSTLGRGDVAGALLSPGAQTAPQPQPPQSPIALPANVELAIEAKPAEISQAGAYKTLSLSGKSGGSVTGAVGGGGGAGGIAPTAEFAQKSDFYTGLTKNDVGGLHNLTPVPGTPPASPSQQAEKLPEIAFAPAVQSAPIPPATAPSAGNPVASAPQPDFAKAPTSSPGQATRKMEFAKNLTDEPGHGEHAAGITSVPPPPVPGAVFLGYDDPGKFEPQALAASGGIVGVPITGQLPLAHWRIGNKDVYGEAEGGRKGDGTKLPGDKAPFLGDLPLVGRFFRSETDPSGGMAAPPSPSLPGLVAQKQIADLDGERGLVREDVLRRESSLNKSGAGALTLNGINTFGDGGHARGTMNYVNDGTIISAGTLAVGDKEGRASSLAEKKDGEDLYKLNIVGYANVPTTPGFTFQSLDFSSGGQTLSEKAEGSRQKAEGNHSSIALPSATTDARAAEDPTLSYNNYAAYRQLSQLGTETKQPAPQEPLLTSGRRLPAAKGGKEEPDRRKLAEVAKQPSNGKSADDRLKAATAVRDAAVLFEMRKLDEATAKLKEAIKTDPANQQAYYYVNLIQESRYLEAQNKRDVTSRHGMVEVEEAWFPRAKREFLPSPNSVANTPKVLADRLEEQDAKIRQAQQNVVRLQKALEIPDSIASEAAPTPLMSSETLRHLEGQRIEGKVELTRQETLVNQLKSIEKEKGKDKLAQVIQTAAPDPQLGSLLEQQNMAEQRLIIVEKEFGPNHAEVARAKTQLDGLKKKTEERSKVIVAGMDTRVASLKDDVAKLEQKATYARSNDLVQSERSRPYFEAKRTLEELQGFQKIINQKIASENLDITLPKSAMVEVVDKAVPQPPKSPSLLERLGGVKSGEVASTARIKIGRDQSDITGISDRGTMGGYDPYFIQTEFELIQSEAILGKVIKDLKLDEAWAKPGSKLNTSETVALLKKKLDLKPDKNTSLIDISVKSGKPEEAAKIANAVAEAYKDYRLAQWKERSISGIRTLEDRSKEQEPKIREAQEKVAKLQAELKISDGAANQSPTQTEKKEPDIPKQARPAAPAAEPQPEVQTCDNAFSTFSLNISDVSFKLAMASLEKGILPEAASVRSEEFLNAFDYRDPEPPPGAPIGFAWERARYPFAQNRDLLRFSLKTAALGRQPGRPLNLVLLLDNSGSMERADRVRIIHEALRVLAGQLQAQDKFSVVTFSRTARLVVDGVSGSDAARVVEEISGLTPQGGTNLEDAMNTAYATALRHYLANGVNRVVLLTDGAANLGNVEPDELKQKVEAHRKQGVALDCFGIGWEGFNDDLLEVLSRNGDGRYGFINTPEEAATEFAGQLAGALHVAASDVKVQIEFNPKRVTAYRQIGYAKHQLTKQQFRDNTVDAAEIAAAEAGNALYVVEVNPRGEGPLGTVRVRYKVPGTSEYHEHEWEAPYNGNAVALEQASPAMRLAATSSAFSEWLVSSPYAGEVTPDGLLGYLSGVPEVYGVDARPKKLEWMIRQAKSVVGK